MCIKDFHNPHRESLPGLERVMSIDEFVAFATDVLSSEAISVDLLKQQIDEVLEEMNVKREQRNDNFDISALNMGFVHFYMKKYGMDDTVIEEYREKKDAVEKKKKRKEELEQEKGVIEYDIKQIYDEIGEEKQVGDEDAKQRIKELYDQINELKNQLKEVKNELYYL